jgi:hypothetical protein
MGQLRGRRAELKWRSKEEEGRLAQEKGKRIFHLKLWEFERASMDLRENQKRFEMGSRREFKMEFAREMRSEKEKGLFLL